MRAVAVPTAVRAAALRTLEPSASSAALLSGAAPAESKGLLGQIPRAAAASSSVFSFAAPAARASHLTLLPGPGAVVYHLPSRPPAEGAAAGKASRPAPWRTQKRGSVGPSLASSSSTEELMQGLLAWVAKRKYSTASAATDHYAMASDDSLQAARTVLLSQSAVSVQQAIPAGDEGITAAAAAAGAKGTRASVPSLRSIPSWHPQSAEEETVLVDIGGVRRFDTWGFCDCVLGTDVDKRTPGDAGFDMVASPRRGDAAAVASSPRFHGMSAASLPPSTSVPSSPLLDLSVEHRESPLAVLLRGDAMQDAALRSPRSLGVEAKTSELFAAARPYCQSLVAETWVEVLYIPRDGDEVRSRDAAALFAPPAAVAPAASPVSGPP